MLAARAADATGGLGAGVRGAVLARADVAAVVLLVLGVALGVAPAVGRLLAGRPPASWRRHLVTWLLPLYALWIPVVVIDAVVVHPTASWRAWLASIVLFRDPRGAPVPGLGIGPVLTVLAVTIVLVPVAERLLRRTPDGDAAVTPSTLLRGAALLAAVGLVVRAVLVVGGATAPFGALSWWPAHLDAVAGGIAVATLRTTGWAAAPRRRLGAAALATAVLALAVDRAAAGPPRHRRRRRLAARHAVRRRRDGDRPRRRRRRPTRGPVARSLAVVAPGVVLTGDIAFITIARQHVEAVVDGPAGLRLTAPALPAWAWSLTIAAAIGVLLTAAVIVPLRRAPHRTLAGPRLPARGGDRRRRRPARAGDHLADDRPGQDRRRRPVLLPRHRQPAGGRARLPRAAQLPRRRAPDRQRRARARCTRWCSR